MRRRAFEPDPDAVAAYVSDPESIAWEQRCYLAQPYLGGLEKTPDNARSRYAYVADDARVLGYPSIIDRAHQMAAVVAILERS